MNLVRVGLVGFSGASVILASLGASAQTKDTGPTLDIRFEPSGTHVDEQRNLKIRLDFYPGPEDKSYTQQHVFVVDETSPDFLQGYPGEVDKDGNPTDPSAYSKWLDSLPHIWRTNPALCHFVTVSPDITKETFDTWVKATFTADVTATIDASAIELNAAHLLSPYMKTKTAMSMAKIAATEDTKSLVETINSRLTDYIVIGSSNSQTQPLQPKSIDVGPGAYDYVSSQPSTNTWITTNNPSNGTGILDTWETWFATNGAGVEVATFYIVSGSNYSTRDYESIGSVTAGSKQTFTGLSTDVSTNDNIGIWWTSGGLEFTTPLATHGGRVIRTGDNIPCTNQLFGGYNANYAISLYATGTEGWTNIIEVGGVDQSTINDVGTVLGTNIGTIAGIAP